MNSRKEERKEGRKTKRGREKERNLRMCTTE
jgi:hypothetical protein